MDGAGARALSEGVQSAAKGCAADNVATGAKRATDGEGDRGRGRRTVEAKACSPRPAARGPMIARS